MSRYDFQEDRNTLIYETLKQGLSGAAPTGYDISAGTLSVRFRMYSNVDDADFIIDEVMDKIDSGTGGVVSLNVIPLAAYRDVFCRVLLVDAAVVASTTPTGFRETVFGQWRDTVEMSL